MLMAVLAVLEGQLLALQVPLKEVAGLLSSYWMSKIWKSKVKSRQAHNASMQISGWYAMQAL